MLLAHSQWNIQLGNSTGGNGGVATITCKLYKLN